MAQNGSVAPALPAARRSTRDLRAKPPSAAWPILTAMGFGHRIFRHGDPRPDELRKAMERLGMGPPAAVKSQLRFAPDSPLEGDGFEPSVPRPRRTGGSDFAAG